MIKTEINQSTLYVVYTTTNEITGESYTGVFSYNPLTRKGQYKYEKYIGQGITHQDQAGKMKPTAFTKNVEQYGYESFSRKEILITSDETVAYSKEAELVDAEYVNNLLTLNQRTGGKKGKLGKASRKRRSVMTTGGRNPKAKAVKCVETGKTFKCIKDAAKALKISYDKLKYELKNNIAENVILL